MDMLMIIVISNTSSYLNLHSSQKVPLNPALHSQNRPFTPGTQLPPFLHGLSSHMVGSVTQGAYLKLNFTISSKTLITLP